jgi:hypothetical protein
MCKHWNVGMQDQKLVFVGVSSEKKQFQYIMCLITVRKDSPNAPDGGRIQVYIFIM